jgi:RNA polymerase sigma-70 factor (ECF subfamily)
MADESFERLAEAAQAGDAKAREVLFARAARLVYARVYRTVRDLDLASDIAQEALIQAVVALPQLRAPDAFLSWLRAIADRAASAYRRRAGRERAELMSEPPAVDSGRSPEEQAHVRMAAQQVRRAMAALPPRNRLMVELFYFEGMTCAEVAEFLRVSRDAVKTTLSRSRRRLRRSVRSVSPTSAKPTQITSSMVSGEHHPDGPLFPHDSDIARFYLAMYPRGLPDRAAAEAEVTPERAGEIIAFLEERRLIAKQNRVWRCTMPVVSDVDLEVLRPWAEEAAGVVTGQLSDLYAQASDIAQLVEGEQAQQTVLAVALFSEAETLPMRAIHEAMRVSAAERGKFGEYLPAVSTAAKFPTGFNGHISSGHQDTGDGEFRFYYLHPVGTDRGSVQEFMRGYNLSTAGDWGLGGTVFRFLFSLATAPAEEDEVAGRVAACGIDTDDPQAFVRGLARLRAIRRVGDRFQAAIPVVPMEPWVEYMQRLTAMGEQVAQTVGDNADELRSRVMRCSFAECNLADAVVACIMYLRGLIGDEIRRRGWVKLPDRADFSWGCLLVC